MASDDQYGRRCSTAVVACSSIPGARCVQCDCSTICMCAGLNVTFGGIAATNVITDRSRQLITTPAHAAGTVDVAVAVLVETSVLTTPVTPADQFTYGVPSTATSTPTSGATTTPLQGLVATSTAPATPVGPGTIATRVPASPCHRATAAARPSVQPHGAQRWDSLHPCTDGLARPSERGGAGAGAQDRRDRRGNAAQAGGAHHRAVPGQRHGACRCARALPGEAPCHLQGRQANPRAAHGHDSCGVRGHDSDAAHNDSAQALASQRAGGRPCTTQKGSTCFAVGAPLVGSRGTILRTTNGGSL
jgi:hypothetical protein